MNFKNNPNVVPYIGLALFIIPYILLGNGAYIRIHDTLEGELLWYWLPVKHGLMLDFSTQTTIPEVMNGLPRAAFHSGLNISMWWIWLFGPYWGYILNNIFLHVIAFFGMRLLLKKTFEIENDWIVNLTSLGFAWIPFFAVFGASVAGQPWVLWAFLNILDKKDKNKIVSWLILFIFPFYSSIVWAAPATLGGLGILWAMKSWRIFSNRKKTEANTERINWLALACLLSVGALYIAANFQIFQLQKSGFVSHRADYDYFFDQPLSLVYNITEMLSVLFLSHYHVGTIVGIPALVAYFLQGTASRGQGTGNSVQGLRVVVVGIVFIVVFYGFYNWVVYFLGGKMPIFAEFKFNRITILLPMLWMLLLGLSVNRLWLKKGISERLIYVLLGSQLLLNIAANDEFQHNVRHLFGCPKKPNFQQFVAEKQFSAIAAKIGIPKDKYHIISLGLNPTIAQYNGFQTIDGLQAIYSLKHKQLFADIIKDELAKDKALSDYFNKWGNRCYMFSAELGKTDSAFVPRTPDKFRMIKDLQINTQAIATLNTRYIFSSVRIGNSEDLHLELVGEFSDKDSWWMIWVYEVM